ALGSLPTAAQPGPEAIGAPTDEAIAAFFDDLIPAQLRARNVPGASVAVVRGGRLAFSRGYGLADIETQRPVVAEETLFHIGSSAKVLTWTMVMQQVEQGRLHLDADINEYLDFRIPATYSEPITLRHLMTHTAGFENRDFGWLARDAESIVPLGTWLAGNVPARVRPPGVQTGYSNYGTALAGYIVERASGTPYLDYLEGELLKPLEMASSTSRQPPPADLEARMARGYALVNGQLQEQMLLPYQGLPAGTVRATAPDVARFMLAHLQDGRLDDFQMLTAPAAAQMRQTLFRVDPRVNGMAHGFIEMDRNGERIVGHIGSAAPLYYSILALLPERGIGVFVAYNADTARPLTVGNETIAAFADRFFPVVAEAPAATRPDAAARVSELVGRYRRNNFGGSYTTVEKVGRLTSSVTDRTVANPGDGTLELRSRLSGSTRLVEVEPDFFREVGGQDAVVFRRNDSGRVAWAAFSGEPIYAFERVSALESPEVNLAALAISSALLGSALLAALVSRLRWRNCAPQPRLAHQARLVAIGVALTDFVFLVGLVLILSDPAPVMGDFSRLRALLVLPMLGGGLTIATLAFTALAWARHWWTGAARTHYTSVALGAAAFLWFQATWNLLGFRL
ncbi:MAG TPA: serine hydrolase domain-containing protein, partial [Chloroflexota bacterium]|nr:serine hydrolase domain-containing protein [Chloroflexota bacterium]